MTEQKPWPTDLQDPTGALLTSINDLTKKAEEDDAGVTGINTTVTNLTKAVGSVVGVVGGGAAIITGVKGLFTYVDGDSQGLRAVFVASASVLGAATVIALAIIIRSDLQSRASAVSARRMSQAHMVKAVLDNFQFASPPAAPTFSANYAVKRAGSGDWVAVEGFSWENGNIKASLTGVPDSVDNSGISDLIDLRAVMNQNSAG